MCAAQCCDTTRYTSKRKFKEYSLRTLKGICKGFYKELQYSLYWGYYYILKYIL